MSLNSTLLALDSDVFTPEYFLQDDICRLCWNKNAHRIIAIEPLEYEGTNDELVDKIRDCLDIDLSQKSYPNKACVECCIQIEKFYEFKSFCKETDRRLQIILKNKKVPLVKLENIEELPIELSKSDSLDGFLDCLESDSEDVTIEKKCKIKNRYKPKRSATYCNICLIDYKDSENFSQHNAEAHGIEDNGDTFKCFGCEKRFKSRKARLSHEINFCKGLKDGYKCSVCERHLPKRRMYEAHMRDHRNNVTVKLPEDIFKCKKCYKLFKTRESLKKHSALHESEKKNFVCESCGRVFTRQDYLHKHKLTHTGVKQHVCPHCGFRAAQRSSLTVHIRKHTGERPYSCDVCPQRCISSSNLRAHRRRHLGVKSYECNICSKKFGYKISLEEHVASTHERSQSHPCQHCGAIYTRIRGLRRHLLAKHGKQDGKDSKIEKKNEQTEFYLKIVTDDEKEMLKDVSCMKDDDFMKSQDQVFVV